MISPTTSAPPSARPSPTPRWRRPSARFPASTLRPPRLWGSDLFVEAPRVEDDDAPVPAEPVRERFGRWVAGAGIGPRLKTTRLPGRDGSYVIFAAGAPA
jgi:hypothetical protein